MNVQLANPVRTAASALLAMLLAGAASGQVRAASWADSIAFPKTESPTALFNGHDLTGWVGETGKYWSVEAGTIRGANDGPVPASTYLFTEKPYRNFRLLLEVRQTRGPKFFTTHSAVAVLGEKIQDAGGAFGFKGPLLMFCNDWGIWDANRRNRVYPAKHEGTWLNPAEKTGDWNRIEILVIGDRIRMVANGRLVIDFTDQPGMLRASPIGLQLHANSQPEEYHFRGLILSENPENRLLTQNVAGKASMIENARRIVFLGDSNTHAGGYINFIEAQMRLQKPGRFPEIINLGLPSETCDGLSEPDHPFLRPDVHERLDRALAKLQPDVVVACYGMNDGIYYPFSEERFNTYKRGINLLIEKIHAAGAKLVLLTPPPFDPLPQRKQGKLRPQGAEKFAWFAIYENYDEEVIRRYADWILEQNGRVEMTVDLHTPVNAFLRKQRETNPDFAMSPDGVHVNEEGHRLLAAAILKAWGYDEPASIDPAVLKLIAERQAMLRDAWLTEVGHKRPGMEPGLPLAEATVKAAAMEARIDELLEQKH